MEKHSTIAHSFGKYLQSLDVNNPNTQVQQQLTELQKLLREIKVKENRKIDDIEKKIRNEKDEIHELNTRIEDLTKSAENKPAEDREHFRQIYVKFVHKERKELCAALKDAAIPCELLKECYTYCEKQHKDGMVSLSKHHFVSQQSSEHDMEQIFHIQRKCRKDTAIVLMQKFESERRTSSHTLSSTYAKLLKVCDKAIVDDFLLKVFEVCWVMLSQSPAYKFSFDKFIKSDAVEDTRMSEPLPIPDTKKKKKKGSVSRPKSTYKVENLEIKYPAIVQGSEKISWGLRQKKIF